MPTKTSLLTALRKYRPRDKSDPLENFITEAFAWLLHNHEGFGRFFFGKVASELQFATDVALENLVWSTQVNYGGVYPDMICQAGRLGLVFEHKAWAHLHENQLSNYRAEAEKEFGAKENFRVVLITGGSHQHDQNPDLALCWHHIYRWIKDWKDQREYAPDYMFDDFCQLLEAEGMGPPAPISHQAILSYLPAQNFEFNLGHLINRVSKYAWGNILPEEAYKLHMSETRGRPWGDDRWGRIGLNLFGMDGIHWSPGIFVGFLMDSWDHNVAWLNPTCPDFSVILDFKVQLFPDYDQHPLYMSMKAELRDKIQCELPDLEFHDHLESGVDNPNRWHPIHIRMPMVDLFRGTITAEDQDKRFIEKASSILKIIAACEPFWSLRKELQKSQETTAS